MYWADGAMEIIINSLIWKRDMRNARQWRKFISGSYADLLDRLFERCD